MSKLLRKDASKELSALARLRDRDIDTSDIPEIKDWSRAIVGRFYKPGVPRSFLRALNIKTPARGPVVELGDTGAHSTSTARISEMTHAELVKACMEGTPEAWPEFIRRYNRLIANVVTQAARQWGTESVGVLADLIQEVYVHFCADNYRLLRAYEGDENSFFSYLKVVARNVVHDYFWGVYRTSESGDLVLHEADEASLVAPESAASSQEREVLLEQIHTILKTTASEEDRAIFRLYYRHGFTASEIAAIPEINLSIKGVESLLHQLITRVRSELLERHVEPNPATKLQQSRSKKE